MPGSGHNSGVVLSDLPPFPLPLSVLFSRLWSEAFPSLLFPLSTLFWPKILVALDSQLEGPAPSFPSFTDSKPLISLVVNDSRVWKAVHCEKKMSTMSFLSKCLRILKLLVLNCLVRVIYILNENLSPLIREHLESNEAFITCFYGTHRTSLSFRIWITRERRQWVCIHRILGKTFIWDI